MSALEQSVQSLEGPLCRRKLQVSNRRFEPIAVNRERRLWSSEILNPHFGKYLTIVVDLKEDFQAPAP